MSHSRRASSTRRRASSSGGVAGRRRGGMSAARSRCRRSGGVIKVRQRRRRRPRREAAARAAVAAAAGERRTPPPISGVHAPASTLRAATPAAWSAFADRARRRALRLFGLTLRRAAPPGQQGIPPTTPPPQSAGLPSTGARAFFDGFRTRRPPLSQVGGSGSVCTSRAIRDTGGSPARIREVDGVASQSRPPPFQGSVPHRRGRGSGHSSIAHSSGARNVGRVARLAARRRAARSCDGRPRLPRCDDGRPSTTRARARCLRRRRVESASVVLARPTRPCRPGRLLEPRPAGCAPTAVGAPASTGRTAASASSSSSSSSRRSAGEASREFKNAKTDAAQAKADADAIEDDHRAARTLGAAVGARPAQRPRAGLDAARRHARGRRARRRPCGAQRTTSAAPSTA